MHKPAGLLGNFQVVQCDWSINGNGGRARN